MCHVAGRHWTHDVQVIPTVPGLDQGDNCRPGVTPVKSREGALGRHGLIDESRGLA